MKHFVLISISMMFYSFLAPVSAQNIVWSDEAESGILSGSSEINTGCTNASNEEFVKLNSDAGNSLLFDNIVISSADSYSLKLYYFHTGEQPLEILVNGSSIGIVVFPAAIWCYQGKASEIDLSIELITGINTLEFRTANGQEAPFLDKLEIYPVYPQREGPQIFYISSSEGDDSNNGLSEQSPWKSLGIISWVPLIPGDTILFKSGDTFTGQFEVNGSGNSDNPVVIGKYGEGNLPIIDGANAAGGACLSAIYINNQDHIELKDLEITNDRRISREGVDDRYGYGIYVRNSGERIMRNFHFRDLRISEVYALTTEGEDFDAVNVAGILFQSEQNTIAGKEKNISDVLVEDCYISHTTKIGIWSKHGSGSVGIGNDSINRNMNLVFRNNHFFETGGSSIILSRSYNCLLENNTFEYPGSDADPRMLNRGSGAWFWKCMNVIAQYNKSLHVRGYADSYGMHIDFGNRNVILQYNYSEDSEGGFVEILGDNVNSVYRFNVSVNDGIRDKKGNTIWISDYVGSGIDGIPSDSSYIYNNSIYVSDGLTPDIVVTGKKTFIYNNVFYTTSDAIIGETVDINTSPVGGALIVSNNLFYGDIRNEFTALDRAPIFGDPAYTNPGSLSTQGYQLLVGSAALDAGKTFEEPQFPMAGKGIFKDIPLVPEHDMYGNPVSVSTQIPNIGAYNGVPLGVSVEEIQNKLERAINIYPDNSEGKIYIDIDGYETETLNILMYDIFGQCIFSTQREILPGANKLNFDIRSQLSSGIFIVLVNGSKPIAAQKILIY